MPDGKPYIYELVDPKSGATYEFESPTELDGDQLLRMKDRYFAPAVAVPTESALPEGGPAPGSAVDVARTVGKTVLREAPAVALSAALPGAAPLIQGGVATGGRMAARAGLAIAGDAIGRTIGQGAVDGTVPGASETIGGGLTSGLTQFAFDAAGRALFTPAGKTILAQQLTGATQFGVAHPLTETAAGQLVKDVLPRVNATVNKTNRRFYAAVRAAGKGIPAAPQPTAMTKLARDIRDGLPAPDQTVIADQYAGIRKVLDRVIERGEPKAVKSSIFDAEGNAITSMVPAKPATFSDLLRDERELREELGKFQDRFNPNTIEGGILSRLSESLHGEIVKRAKGTPAEAAMIAATQNFKQNVAPFREGLNAVMKDQYGPTDVIDVYARAGRPDRLAALYKQLPAAERNQFSAAWFKRASENAMDPQTGVFNPATFLKEWNSLGVPAQRILAQGQHADVVAIANRLGTLQRRADMISTVGKYAGGAASIGGIYAGLKALNDGEISRATAYFSGAAAPWVMPALLSDPRAVRFLAQGLRAPDRSRLAVRYGRQLAQTVSHVAAAAGQITAPAEPVPNDVMVGAPQ